MPFALKKWWSLLTAVLLLVAAAADNPQGKPEGARLTGSRSYLLFEALTRGQGVATDGQFFYFSGNYFLNKTDIETNKTVAENPLAIPPALLLKGGNHIGGIAYYDGTIYAPIEDGPDYLHPYIALFDAETLRYTGVCYELPRELHIEGVPWCAVDAERGYFSVRCGGYWSPNVRSKPSGMIRSSRERSATSDLPRPIIVESMPMRMRSRTFSTPV